MFQEFRQSLKKTATLGVQEDHFFFVGSKEDKHKRGKLFLLDAHDFDVHEIFFDDNTLKKMIIDPWDVNSKQRLNYDDILDKFMVDVDTVQVVLDEDYFINKFKECAQNREKDYVHQKQ